MQRGGMCGKTGMVCCKVGNLGGGGSVSCSRCARVFGEKKGVLVDRSARPVLQPSTWV